MAFFNLAVISVWTTGPASEVVQKQAKAKKAARNGNTDDFILLLLFRKKVLAQTFETGRARYLMLEM